MGPLEFCKYAILFECHHSKRCIDKKCRSTISHFALAKWHIRRIRLRGMHLPFASAVHSPECRYTEWRYAKCHSNECRCTERRYAKCRSTICHFASAKWQSRCIRLSFAIGECGVLPLACQWQMANAKCHYTECRTTEYRCTKWRHVKCHCIICHFASAKWQSHCPPSSLV